MYLQIEEATRLTVRLSERSGHARQTHDFRIKKAGRFRGGASAAVDEVTFGDGESYLALKDGGIVDMDASRTYGLNLQLARPNNQAPHSIRQTFRTTQPIGLGGLTPCAASPALPTVD